MYKKWLTSGDPPRITHSLILTFLHIVLLNMLQF